MRNAVAFPILLVVILLQTAVISSVNLLYGFADLILIIISAWALQNRVTSAWHWVALACTMLSFISKSSPLFIFIGYFSVVYMAQILQKRVWQAPLLAMFTVILFGTLFTHILAMLPLILNLGLLTVSALTDFLRTALFSITLPSLLLNLLLSVPVYVFMRDLSIWVYPLGELE